MLDIGQLIVLWSHHNNYLNVAAKALHKQVTIRFANICHARTLRRNILEAILQSRENLIMNCQYSSHYH